MVQCRIVGRARGEPLEGVVSWFARRGEAPLSPPFRLREYTPLDDDPDNHGNFTNDKIRGVAFALEYCDGRGWASLRTVRCLALDPQHPASLSAYCHVRQAERTFRVDRIISIADLRSGRILSGNEQLALLAPYLPREYPDPDFPALFRLQDATRDGVFALLQLAMPNGRLGAAARVAVLNYVKAEAQALRHVVPPHAYIDLWIDNLSPPLEAVAASVANLLEDKDRFARLLPWLLKVMRCQESFAQQEHDVRELISEVRKHFRHKLFQWPDDLRATR